jgi:hypothetical protein
MSNEPHCTCCGMRHGRALRRGEHCDWCTAHRTKTTTSGNTKPKKRNRLW